MKVLHLTKTIVPVFALAISGMIFLVSGFAQTDAATKFTDAAQYYKDGKCVVCHGAKAEKKFNTELKDEEMVDAILKGKKPAKPPNMPAYEPKGISAEQAKALVEYMKKLKSTP
jgi:mono/diheme cytochrome c family protein